MLFLVMTKANREIAGQVQQPYIPVPKHSELDFESMYLLGLCIEHQLTTTVTVDDENNEISQAISINGKEISRQSDSKSTPSENNRGSEEMLTVQKKQSTQHTSTPATNATKTPAAP